MLSYCLQIVIFQLIFLISYDLFHKKDTFFNWNRGFLLITPILSLLLPFAKVAFFKTPVTTAYVEKLESAITLTRILQPTNPHVTTIIPTAEHIGLISTLNVWEWIYIIGIAITFILLCHKLTLLYRTYQKTTKKRIGNITLATLQNGNQAFSFWNTIFIGDQFSKMEYEQIIVHELVHIKHKHSLDQMIFEILKIVLWWNPLVYIYQSRMTELHEFIADKSATQQIGIKKYVYQLLNSTFQTEEIPFVQQFFNHSSIKKRIVMLQKQKSKSIHRFKYLFIVPALIGILTYTSCSEDEKKDMVENHIDKNEYNKPPKIRKPNLNYITPSPIFDYKLDNFLLANTSEKTEAIITLVNIKTKENIRSQYIPSNTSSFIRNIPEGKYYLQIIYGTDLRQKMVDGQQQYYFAKNEMYRKYDPILDFSLKQKTKENSFEVPSYKLELEVELENNILIKTYREQKGDILELQTKQKPKSKQKKHIAEPECLNKNSSYDKKLDNYLKLEIGDHVEEVLIDVTHTETKEVVRKIHLTKNSTQYIRNIPEDTYSLQIVYGNGYIEKEENGICTATFKNITKTEEGKDLLDFNVIRTEDGKHVPSYSMSIDLLPEDLE